MRFPKTLFSMIIAVLIIPFGVWAQEKPERELEIHKNIKLVELGISADIPEDIATQYRTFLPIFEDSLREATTAQPDECFLTIRVTAGMKEVGAAKTKRPLARITAFRRNSKQEYVNHFILYSYVNQGPVNKEETVLFLKKSILEPNQCTAKPAGQ